MYSCQHEWLWQGRVPLGGVTLITGPSVGKGLITADMAARVSTGRAFPESQTAIGPSSVVLMNADDTPSDVLVPRLTAAGADLTKITGVTEVVEHRLDGSVNSQPVDLLQDVDVLESRVRELDDCRLLIIDPLFAFCTSRKAAIRRLRDLACHLNLAVVVVDYRMFAGCDVVHEISRYSLIPQSLVEGFSEFPIAYGLRSDADEDHPSVIWFPHGGCRVDKELGRLVPSKAS